jgi:chlorobactene glucosyltransferase
MILTITGIVILLLTFLRFAVALANMTSRPYLPVQYVSAGNFPSLSVLVPVRNEEDKIGTLLRSLVTLSYDNAEIIVYDDGSTDSSASVIGEYARDDKRIRYIRGTDLPEGWTGKNHACHRLASVAKGEYLLFIDADVIAGNDLFRRAVSYSLKHRLTLLSIFPGQEMITTGEKIAVPFMFRILLSLLPLFLIRRCRWSSFSAANGQMMLFRSADYRRYHFHERMKDRLAEDIEIMRFVKRNRLRGDTLVGSDEIRCRMYGSYGEAVRGFSKNIFSMFGNSITFLMIFALTGLLGWIVLLLLPWYYITLYLAMIISLNMMVAVTSRQKISENMTFLLPGIAAFYHIAFLAARAACTGNHEWKGRKLKGK